MVVSGWLLVVSDLLAMSGAYNSQASGCPALVLSLSSTGLILVVARLRL